MRAILRSFLAVIGMLVLGVLLHIVSFAFGIVGVGITNELASSCTPPQSVPTTAGKLVAIDLRQPSDGSLFESVPREAWIDQTVAKLAKETDPARDLVVYVHGFRTNFAEATCAGENLRADLAGLPEYDASGGPDVFVFGWPSEFSLIFFQWARENADRAGHYLGGVLQQLKNRRVFLVSHSLGAEVIMTAAGDLPEPASTPPLAGMLLVEGAITALSIRSWQSTLTETSPHTDLENAMHGKPPSKAFVETQGGKGRFIEAAARAAHLAVTTAGGDGVLASPFKLNETLLPPDKNDPIIPGEVGDDTGNWIAAQAIGIPFPTSGIRRHFEKLLPDGELHKQSKFNLPEIFPTDPWKVMYADDWYYEFKVEHPSFHEIPLTADWWKILYDWHGVMNDKAFRPRILTESWAFFTGQTN
jgi:pimeloyl-ACP methyl ester carboxylesterase